MLKLKLLIFLVVLSPYFSDAQEDSAAYQLYKDKIVLYSDIGFNSAPFSIKDDFVGGFKRIRFKHNISPTLGFGVAHKWFSLRIGFGLPVNLKSNSRFGISKNQDLGLKFSTKKMFWDFDFHNYLGYAIMDAYQWDDSLNSITPNLLRPRTRAASFSINSWYFKSDDYRMHAVLGKVGDFKKSTGTWYFKGTLNLFGVSNEDGPLVPEQLIDTTKTKSLANSASALDIGFVPGYAYTYKYENWQVSAFAGFGGVLQAKFFGVGPTTRGFLGLAPRMDMRFIAGYSRPKYFFWFTSDFDIKSISFQELKYRQIYYAVKLVAGVRLDKKKKSKKDHPTNEGAREDDW